jgi:glycosyltransferase involved in cell wall biosynthesis
MSKRGLFIHSGIVNSGVIESQVIDHVLWMKKNDVVMDLMLCAYTSTDYQNGIKILEKLKAEVDVYVVKLWHTKNALHYLYNKRKIQRIITAKSYHFIHARYEYNVCYLSGLKQSIKKIWDCRGDVVAETDFVYSQNVVRKLLKPFALRLKKEQFKKAANDADCAIAVTNCLKEMIKQQNPDIPVSVIPCPALDERFFYSSNLRQKYRDCLKFAANDRVLVYAGGVGHYHCTGEIIDIFKQLFDRDTRWRLLFLTNKIEEAISYLSILETHQYKIFQVNNEEVNGYLNAADAAIIIRKNHPLNYVASPTKFAEYVSTGLPVVISDSIGDSSKYIKENSKLGVLDTDFKNINKCDFSSKSRTERSALCKKVYSRNSYASEYLRIYGIT